MKRVSLILGIILFSSCASFAQEYKAPLGAKIKNSPKLALELISITPKAIVPVFGGLRGLIEDSGDSNSKIRQHKIEKLKALQKEFNLKYPEKIEEFTNTPIASELFNTENISSDVLLYTEENFDYKLDIIKKLNEVITPEELTQTDKEYLKGMLISTNKDTHKLFSTFLENVKNQKINIKEIEQLCNDTNLYTENLDSITEEINNGNYIEYLSLYNVQKEEHLDIGYDFKDNYKTFLLLKNEGFSKEKISKILNLPAVQLISGTFTAFTPIAHDRKLKYRYKAENIEKILAKDNLNKEEKYYKITKKCSKTKMEKITTTPITEGYLDLIDATLAIPMTALEFTYFLTLYGPVKNYSNVYNEWLGDIKYEEYLKNLPEENE